MAALARVFVAETQHAWDKQKTGDSCQDCTQIVELLKDLLSNTAVQTEIRSELEKMCEVLPGPTAPKLCQETVDKYFTLGISFLTNVVKPAEVCSMLGLCNPEAASQLIQLLTNHNQEGLMSSMKTMNVQFNPQCTFCVYLIKSLENMLPKVRTEIAVIDLVGKMCDILPQYFQKQCHNLIEKYGKILVDMLLTYTSPKAICTFIQVCVAMDTPLVASDAPTDCDSCLTLAVLTRLQLGSNASESQTTSFVDSVCQLHPNALPKCTSFTQRHGQQLTKVLGKAQPALDVCEGVGLCGGVREEDGQEGDMCTLVKGYKCRNLTTAQECGTVSFCEKYVWK
ncbi:hypothetical protein DPEC_G00336220 [Dallia pectoralis]|uniref:Uncharacterized protein n=1 Tax=Dallia pectoralis TaxID=75939 RepID=A0ACC2F747_DALPE|nr:hypothetical protein DPEC_G00336220 [Dallia pectoralis]